MKTKLYLDMVSFGHIDDYLNQWLLEELTTTSDKF